MKLDIRDQSDSVLAGQLTIFDEFAAVRIGEPDRARVVGSFFEDRTVQGEVLSARSAEAVTVSPAAGSARERAESGGGAG